MTDPRAHEAARHFQTMNCCQAVLTAFQDEAAVPDDAIAAAKGCGGGKAPDGRCGALEGALRLVPDADDREQIMHAFAAKTGSFACKDIRRAKRATCRECVEHAAALAETIRQAAPERIAFTAPESPASS